MAEMNPAMEEAMKRMQGLQDARSKMGQLSRGNNMYPAGAQATTGGGPGFGRPPENPMAQQEQALRQQMVAQQQMNPGPSVNPMASMQGQQNQQMAQQKAMSKQKAKTMASAAIQAAAKRRLQRGM